MFVEITWGTANIHRCLNSIFHFFKPWRRLLKPKHLTLTFIINSSNLDHFVFDFFHTVRFNFHIYFQIFFLSKKEFFFFFFLFQIDSSKTPCSDFYFKSCTQTIDQNWASSLNSSVTEHENISATHSKFSDLDAAIEVNLTLIILWQVRNKVFGVFFFIQLLFFILGNCNSFFIYFIFFNKVQKC